MSNPYCLPEVQKKSHSKEALVKHYNTMKKNNTFKTSTQEDIVYARLLEIFTKSDVKRNYKTTKYPFRCDFYIKSLDLYIECNFHWTHGKMKYDGRKTICKQQLSVWKEKAKKSKYFENAINTWTIRDIAKYKYAKKYKLNYLVFWNIQDALTYNFN